MCVPRGPPPQLPFISRADPALSIQLSIHHGESRTDTTASAASNTAQCFAPAGHGGRTGAQAGGPLRCKLGQLSTHPGMQYYTNQSPISQLNTQFC